jgi:hypothetical protein
LDDRLLTITATVDFAVTYAVPITVDRWSRPESPGYIDEEEELQREKPFCFGGGSGQSQEQQRGWPGARATEEVFPY